MAHGDIFLRLRSAKGGVVKGESSDHNHKQDIELRTIAWGMHGATAMGAAGTANRATMDSLQFTKWVDASSTALMGVLRSNDVVTEATITVRKAGGTASLDYFQIKIKNGRVTSYDLQTDPAHPDRLIESYALSFTSIEVQYKAQDGQGGSGGAYMFQADSA